MRLVWVVIPLILFGIVGIQSVEGQISPGSPFAADLSINNPPNLGETTDVTLTFIDLFSYYSDIEQFPATIRLPDGLELVSGELETMHFWQRGDTLDVTVTVKAIQTGNWTIQGFGFGGAADYLYLVIDEDSSYIHEGNFPSSTLSKYPVEKYREFYDELTQYKAPLKQIRDNGVLPKDVKCNEGKVLFFKASDNSPACVKPETAEKLIERGWAIDENNVQQITYFQPTYTYNTTTQSIPESEFDTTPCVDVDEERKKTGVPFELPHTLPNNFKLKHVENNRNAGVATLSFSHGGDCNWNQRLTDGVLEVWASVRTETFNEIEFEEISRSQILNLTRHDHYEFFEINDHFASGYEPKVIVHLAMYPNGTMYDKQIPEYPGRVSFLSEDTNTVYTLRGYYSLDTLKMIAESFR